MKHDTKIILTNKLKKAIKNYEQSIHFLELENQDAEHISDKLLFTLDKIKENLRDIEK